jgi:protein-S-isoprenylcysteine O-methyltransferase Ste14
MNKCSYVNTDRVVTPVDFLFGATLLAVVALDLSILATLLVPGVQVWPPPGRDTWQYGFTWILFGGATAGVIVVGGLDRGSLGIVRALGASGSFILGSVLVMGGTAVASYPMGYVGRHAALGLVDELATDGPYALCRNPAYVGDLTMLAGYTVLADSWLVGGLALAGAVWYVAAPHAEEPWLEAQYGDAYRRYRRRVPRWLPLGPRGESAR